jgi:LuxR family maltose regulon positive regulatory protein
MQKVAPLIRTKLRQPFLRKELVPRARLQERMAQGLRGPLTLITAPAGFGKTTLVASYIKDCGLAVAWLSLDKDDNQISRFLSYLIATINGVDSRVGKQAIQLMGGIQQASPEEVLTNLVNDMDDTCEEIALVLDDYQNIRSQAVHQAVTFLIEHCPKTFHLVIATRSDPLLPIARLRARGQVVEFRAADLSFTVSEATQFLNGVMGLNLDAESVSVLAERTEGWIAGLQMAALTMRDRKDNHGFIESFSGTSRYILDYLLEEVLVSQSPDIQRFLLCTSILERLTSSLCDAVLEADQKALMEREDRANRSKSLLAGKSASILAYLEKANLFLVPLDNKRTWYRYHHLFSDLLRTQAHKSLGDEVVAGLHLRAAEWHEKNGTLLEAINHASLAADDEMVERLIERHYIDMVNRGEMSWVRYWMGKLSKDLIYRRPWLCLYEALSRSWFGQLEEANLLLAEAKKRIQAEDPAPGTQTMLAYHSFVKSRITAMQGDTRRAIELCLSARDQIPGDNLALQNEFSITLGYEYFVYGDFVNANKVLHETIRSGYTVEAINNPVAAYAILARIQIYQGRLREAHNLLQRAEQLIQDIGGQYLGATGLIEVEKAALLCEFNEIEDALDHLNQGLDFLTWWGKADDLCLAYTTLSRIHNSRGNQAAAAGAVEKATQLIETRGIFSEARSAVEACQVRMWLRHEAWSAIDRWSAEIDSRPASQDPFKYEDELINITRARVFTAHNQSLEAIRLLSGLEESARSCGRIGRLIEIMIRKALAFQAAGNISQANIALTESMLLAEPEGYKRVFLDEGQSMQFLLNQWLSQTESHPVRNFAAQLLLQLDKELRANKLAHEKVSSLLGLPSRPGQDLIEPLSQRELEVLQIMALGKTNQEIAQQLIISPGTVKAHAASIYRKLDVANRTEAVARARQLDLLN